MEVAFGKLCNDVAICRGGHRKIVECLSDVYRGVGTVEIVVVLIHLLLFLVVVVFGREEGLESGPTFVGRRFFTPFLACIVVDT